MIARLTAVLAGILLAAGLVCPAAPSRAAQPAPAASSQKIFVEVSKSHVLKYDIRVRRV